MRNSLFLKSDIFLGITVLVVIIFTSFLLFTENVFCWYFLIAVFVLLQVRFQFNTATLFPIIAALSLTEYYFLFSGKRVYLCELVYIPLLVNYFLVDFFWKRLSYIKFIVLSLFLSIVFFQVINYLVNSDLTSALFRIRSLALPLFLIPIVDNQIKSKADLKRVLTL